VSDPKGFLKIKRQPSLHRPVSERVKDYSEVGILPKETHSQEQATRCMDCGTPFCHWGCPVGNFIPEWNELVSGGQWKKAFILLRATNNLPEITGRLCPAPCEFACVLGINDDPVTIRENELGIIEHAFKEGYVYPVSRPKRTTGKRVAVIGSGPAGLSCAEQLNKAGHKVVVFERDEKPGGILRYGIPDFKLNKGIIDRRLHLYKKEGIDFITGVNVGRDYKIAKLKKDFNAVCLAIGSRTPRDLNIEGRSLRGIHFALEYLIQENKRVSAGLPPDSGLINVRDKRVVVLGGGDTGADCVGTAHRQGAASVIQIELMPCPAQCRPKDTPWPKYPMIFKTSTSHEEGGERHWAVLTKKFIGEEGWVKRISCVRVEFLAGHATGCPVMKEVPGTEFDLAADIVILALGFVHPEKSGLLEELKADFDSCGNVKADSSFMTSVKGVFCAGDVHRGQSLIVWAISEGRRAAYFIDKYLMGESELPLL